MDELGAAEWEVFQDSLGENVHVERTEHLLSGDARCVYRITDRTDHEKKADKPE